MNILSLFPAVPLVMMLGLWLSKSTRQCIRKGDDFIYIKGTEEETADEGHGDFGF